MIKRKFNYCECDAENNYTWNLGVASTTTDRTDYRIKCCITYEFLIVLVWKLEEMKGGTNPYISQIRTKKSSQIERNIKKVHTFLVRFGSKF